MGFWRCLCQACHKEGEEARQTQDHAECMSPRCVLEDHKIVCQNDQVRELVDQEVLVLLRHVFGFQYTAIPRTSCGRMTQTDAVMASHAKMLIMPVV